MLPGSAVTARCALIGLLMAGVAPVAAQLRIDPSVWGAGQDGIRLSSQAALDLRAPARTPLAPEAGRAGLFSSLGLYAYQPVGAMPGHYVRPHYALGLHSDLMRDALVSAGLEARSCIAPMLRLRARPASSVSAGGLSFTLLARCTFH